MIEQLKCCASFIAVLVLPEAVGPPSAIRYLLEVEISVALAANISYAGYEHRKKFWTHLAKRIGFLSLGRKALVIELRRLILLHLKIIALVGCSMSIDKAATLLHH